MPLLIFFMLLFIGLGLIWVVAAGLLAANYASGGMHLLERTLEYKGGPCACHFPPRYHK